MGGPYGGPYGGGPNYGAVPPYGGKGGPPMGKGGDPYLDEYDEMEGGGDSGSAPMPKEQADTRAILADVDDAIYLEEKAMEKEAKQDADADVGFDSMRTLLVVVGCFIISCSCFSQCGYCYVYFRPFLPNECQDSMDNVVDADSGRPDCIRGIINLATNSCQCGENEEAYDDSRTAAGNKGAMDDVNQADMAEAQKKAGGA